MYYRANSASGVTSHAFSFSSSVNAAISFEEWSGVATSTPLDVAVGQQNSKGTYSSTNSTGMLANPAELAIWGLGVQGTSVLSYSGVANGYSEDASSNASSTQSAKAQATLFYNKSVGTSSTSSSCTMSGSGGTGNTTILAVFKPSSGGASTGTHDTSWRGRVGHTSTHDTAWRALLQQNATHDTSWRGILAKNVVDKDTAWRGKLAAQPDHDTSWRGILAKNVVTKDTRWRARMQAGATHDTVWRANVGTAPDPFYASNVASTVGGLTQSCQMAQTTGGVETSVSVTAPASGTNSYVELVSQGGTPGATSALPAPTGKGWSIAFSGQSFPSGNWYGTFTLSKSGTTKSGASLVVRFYRRTRDGTTYLIGQNTLGGQSFTTTKTTYSCVTVQAAAQPWQFISGDTLYMDAFVYNGSTAWASDVFTVYVSTSASLGVANDGVITCPQPVSTSVGLSALVGLNQYATLAGLSIKNESFSLADSIDQRSILSLTAEDVPGTALYTRGQPILFSDSNMGLLYGGWVNSDKITKMAAGGSAQLEHQLTFMDNHYLADKRANTTDYLNWTAGDIVCDFVQGTLSSEGVTGDFAIESDYTPTTFGQGTLTNMVATTTTTPFTYAPNTATPPIVSNTGDLEIQTAGTKFTLTESVTADFSSGTLTNMTASNNSLSPTTVSAVKVIAIIPIASSLANTKATAASNGSSFTQTAENIYSSAYIEIWSGSMTIGANDTLNYDIWISSTSPAFLAGVDFVCSDTTQLTQQCGTPDTNSSTGLYDQNNISVDALSDLTDYAKDTWYTRTVTLTGLNGKTINTVSLYVTGSAAGTYSVFVKNCYLGSQSGSPFFGTAATSTNVNPPLVTTLGAYYASSVEASVVSVYNPLTSYRISPAHSISGVGLVRSSNITWTASLPTTGVAQVTYPPNATAPVAASTGQGSSTAGLILMVSYDQVTWLACSNSHALPGIPPGANVAGISLYLREQFQSSPDPSAIPALEYVYITIASAASTSTSDVTATYGTSAEWNTGTKNGTTPNANGALVLSGAPETAPAWTSIVNQTFFAGHFPGTQSASGGTYTITTGAITAAANGATTSRFDFAGTATDFTLTCSMSVSQSNGAGAAGSLLVYRQTGWSNFNSNFAYGLMLTAANQFVLEYASNSSQNQAGTSVVLVTVSKTITQGTLYPIKIVVTGPRHQCYFNNEVTPSIDIIDYTYTGAGGFGVMAAAGGGPSSSNTVTTKITNYSLTAAKEGTWIAPSVSLSALGTCGYSQIAWTEVSSTGQQQATAIVEASLDGGSTWQTCTNNAAIPQLATRGTSVAGKSLLLQVILSAKTPLVSPVIEGLYLRVCGPYGTVTGTRVSPALSLTNVGYVSNSNCMWNANVPTNTTVTVATSQDASTWTNVGNSGAGAPISYWTNQPSATQDLFNINTVGNYTNTSIASGSASTVTYDTTHSRVTLSGGVGGLYLNNSISCADVELFVDMDESDAGGMVWQEQNTSNYYELGVYDASSAGGFTNQLRLYKVAAGTRSLLGSASTITFNRGTYHRIKVKMTGALINVYFDGICLQSYLDASALGAGEVGLRNDGGTSRYYQLWVQPLGTNLTGQVLYTRTTLTTTDPAQMPQLFTLVAAVRGAGIQTGATISQLHPITTPFAQYFSNEMDTLVQASGDYFWYIDHWRKLQFRPRLARPAAFPLQSVADSTAAGVSSSGSLLYQFPQAVVLTSANDLYRNQQAVTDVTNLVTPPPEIKTADGSATSWTVGYPVYSTPVILINGQSASVGIQGIDNNKQFYWQPGSVSISYDSTLPVLPAGTVISITYTGETTVNDIQNNAGNQTTQAAIEYNTSGIIAEIESALSPDTRGMTLAQATTFANGLLSRFGTNNAVDVAGAVNYFGPSPGYPLKPGTVTSLFLPEMSQNNVQVPIIKITLQGYQKADGTVYYTMICDATNGPNVSRWQQAWQ